MVMVINKRIKRVLFENKAQYIGAILLILFSSFLFTSLVMVGANLTRLLNQLETRYLQEDASFSTNKPIENLPELESAAGVMIEEGKTLDYPLTKEVTLRIFSRNEKIDLPAIIDGSQLSDSGQILLNPVFAKAQNYRIGDVLKIKGKSFIITGFAALPNYIVPLKAETDLVPTPKTFGLGVISQADFADLGQGSSFYSLKYDHPEASPRIQAAKFIKLLKSRGINILQWTDIGVNIRVSGAAAKFRSASMMGIVMPTAFFLLTAVLLGNVIGRMIKREAVIAGALYALGYKRNEIYRHYLTFPLVVSVIGGVIGSFLGLITVRPLLSIYFMLFDMPLDRIDYSPVVIIISLFLPIFFLGISGWLAIRKELQHSPVELMKGDQDQSRVNFLERRFNLEKLKFVAKFQIREQLRSLPRLALLLTGCAAATLLLLFGFFLKSGLDYFLETEVKNGQNYRYEYVFDHLQTAPAPAGAEPFAVSTFLLEDNNNKVFHVAGALPDSNISTVVDENGVRVSMDQVVITKPIADKLNAKPGDTINIVRKSDYQTFSLKVGAIAASYNMSIFLPLDEYNQTFGMPEGSYNELFSNSPLAITQNEPYKVYSIEEKIKAIQNILTPMTSTVGFIAVVAFIIGLIIIYVVTSMIVEESKNTISLMKIFGYRKKEVSALVLNSSTIIVVIGYILGILLCFAVVRGLLQALEDSLTFAMPVMIEPIYIGIGFVVVMLSYELSKLLCRRKVNAVPMSEALKAGME